MTVVYKKLYLCRMTRSCGLFYLLLFLLLKMKIFLNDNKIYIFFLQVL